MIRQTTGVTAPLQKKEKTSQQYMSTDNEFLRYSSTSVDHRPSDFDLWGCLKPQTVFTST